MEGPGNSIIGQVTGDDAFPFLGSVARSKRCVEWTGVGVGGCKRAVEKQGNRERKLQRSEHTQGHTWAFRFLLVLKFSKVL